MGSEVTAVAEGQLVFGIWQHIFYGKFDRPRRKRVLVNIFAMSTFPTALPGTRQKMIPEDVAGRMLAHIQSAVFWLGRPLSVVITFWMYLTVPG